MSYTVSVMATRIRKIIHVDLDAFFCAVEELRRPELKGLPFAVGGKPGQRGVVSSCSYPARMEGVHSAMPTSTALRLCPKLILISPDHHAYTEASDRVMSIFRNWTPLVEQISIDEAFLDVTDLPSEGFTIAQKIQAEVMAKTNLPCSLGVATNKLVAKTATDTAKKVKKKAGPPQAILEIEPGKEAEFMARLPVEALWGVGPRTSDRMKEMGIRWIGDLARIPEKEIVKLFGKNGLDLSRHARGEDDRPVVIEHEVKSISEEVTFDQDVSQEDKLIDTLRSLSADVGRRMRKHSLIGRTVRLKLRWPDFTTLTRQVTVDLPIDQDNLIFKLVKDLFMKQWQAGRAVRLLGVGVSNLQSGYEQLALWDANETRQRKLLTALDMLQERFGKDAVHLGIAGRNKPSGSRE